MPTPTFADTVRERLHPGLYPGLLQCDGSPYELLLARSRGPLANDAFGVLALARGQDARALVEAARDDIEARFGALCFRRQIVLHLLVHGPIEAWRDAGAALCADRTGFRGVMIQSIYVVDSETGASHKSVSRWGALRYTRGSAQGAGEVHVAVGPLLATRVPASA
jgi:hypothetical protein